MMKTVNGFVTPMLLNTMYLIGIPPGDYRIEKYLQDILKLVEQEYQTKNLYIFITSIMRTLVDKAPHLTYKYFYFKDAQIRQRSLNRSNVLIQDDLTYTMQACLKFDSQKLFDLYKTTKICMMVTKVVKNL